MLPSALEVGRVVSLWRELILWKVQISRGIGMYRVLFCVVKVNFVIYEGIICCNFY